MMERVLFHNLVSNEFAKRFNPKNSNWQEVWREIVERVYQQLINAPHLTDSDKSLIELYRSEAMDIEDNVRCCSHCGIPMMEGYYLAGDYACGDECALAQYNGDKAVMDEELNRAEEPDSDVYWTDWINYFLD